MNIYCETAGVTILALVGAALGLWFSRLPRYYWTLGYFIPLAIIGMIGAARWSSYFEFLPPFSWLVAGRKTFALIGFVASMVLTTPLSRLRKRRERVFVALFLLVAVSCISIWPFLAPAFNRTYLASLKTRIDADHICIQNTSYTCGPASAVTALRRLGFSADEGELALLAHTSAAIGTPPTVLCQILRDRYAREGLSCQYQRFHDIKELDNGAITLAVVKFGLLVDHYVAVLEVQGDNVIVGDPLTGKDVIAFDQFRSKWRFTGVVLRRML